MAHDALTDIGYANLAVLEEMHKLYLQDPQKVDPSWRSVFDEEKFDIKEPTKFSQSSAGEDLLRVFNLIQAYRTHGHKLADINPIATHNIAPPHILEPKTYGFRPDDLKRMYPTCGLLQESFAPLQLIIDTLKATYCDRIGVEYINHHSLELERWLQEKIESNHMRPNLSIEEKRMILQHLNKSELFEVFLHTKYSGQKRFSLEGGETLIPIMSAVIETSSRLQAEEFYIGMAHRGRLNVLSNILNKSYSEIFSEFEESYIPLSFEGSGDVKYHLGFSSRIKNSLGKDLFINLAPNPSHLESVNPVVEGQVRARQVLFGDSHKEKQRVVPILIHGDAALSGQGICYETMQLSQLSGYGNGGTIHIVINNQIGFTTLPKDARSTPYCTDISRTFGSPVFHVNGEDPEGCVYATMLAVQLRHRFGIDVFIDLNCYRKYGHNETDEPAFTQPLEYQIIRNKRPARELYRDDLIRQGVLEKEMAESLEQEFKERLKLALEGRPSAIEEKSSKKQEISSGEEKASEEHFKQVETSVQIETLKEIAQRTCTLPENLNPHRKVVSLLNDRLSMIIPSNNEKQKLIDWGMAETLAYGTVLWDGIHVRLTGQDSRRGTFSHRHSIVKDQKEENKYFPLNHLKPDQGRFDVFNSPLSEYGCLGFEFGYSAERRDALVLWEAQFGDFSNGAQIIIDQFLSTSEQKWGLSVGLTLLLPHGYEGQGPEHSSARMERFLALSGQQNMRVVNPTTPAQLFHLIRKQALANTKKPLIAFTPKGLLRHPLCVSKIDELTHGSFKEILDDPNPPKKAKRLAFCTGRIFYDLYRAREENETDDLAIIRIEQLYPLHTDALEKIVSQYPDVEEYFWIQDEPKNMGAWDFIRPYLRDLSPDRKKPHYIGRERSASPAAGSYMLHKKQHVAILDAIFRTPSPISKR